MSSPVGRRLPMSAFSEFRAGSSDAPRWYFYVSAVQFVVGGASFFAGKIGWQFLPSPRWADAVAVPAWILGILFSLFFVGVVYAHVIRFFGWGGFSIPSLATLAAGTYLWFFLGWNVVAVSIPMAIASMSDDPAFVVFLVSDAEGFGYKGCRYPVDLEDMPRFSHTLCDVSPDLRKTLVPGSAITEIGRGSWRGVFVGRVAKVG